MYSHVVLAASVFPAGSGVTALHLAAFKGSHAAVRELLRAGAAADAVTLSGVHNPQLSRGSTALHIAAARGHAGVVTALLDHQTGIPGGLPELQSFVSANLTSLVWRQWHCAEW